MSNAIHGLVHSYIGMSDDTAEDHPVDHGAKGGKKGGLVGGKNPAQLAAMFAAMGGGPKLGTGVLPKVTTPPKKAPQIGQGIQTKPNPTMGGERATFNLGKKQHAPAISKTKGGLGTPTAKKIATTNDRAKVSMKGDKRLGALTKGPTAEALAKGNAKVAKSDATAAKGRAAAANKATLDKSKKRLSAVEKLKGTVKKVGQDAARGVSTTTQAAKEANQQAIKSVAEPVAVAGSKKHKFHGLFHSYGDDPFKDY